MQIRHCCRHYDVLVPTNYSRSAQCSSGFYSHLKQSVWYRVVVVVEINNINILRLKLIKMASNESSKQEVQHIDLSKLNLQQLTQFKQQLDQVSSGYCL